MLKVNEIFESVFGEGIMIGVPCTFIRLAGCNLAMEYGGCKWCDTKYAQVSFRHQYMTEDQILGKVEEFGHKWISITGGEPLMQDLKSLLLKLRYTGLTLNDRRIQLETNCTFNPMQYSLVSRIALSPKLGSSGMAKHMGYGFMSWLNPNDEVKFVIANEEDFNEAIELLQLYKTKAQVIMQPESGVNGKWIVDKILEMHIEEIRVLPQMHKVFNLR